MKPSAYIHEVLGERKAALKERLRDHIAFCDRERDRPGPGWLSSPELIPILRLSYIASVHARLSCLLINKFADVKMSRRRRLYFRLNPRFKNWDKAFEAAKAARGDKIPAGWISLPQLSRELKKTVRALQYFADRKGFKYKVFRSPRETRHYRRDLFVAGYRKKDP